MSEGPNLFTFVEQCRTKSRTHPYSRKLASPYMLVMALGNCNSDLKAVNAMNQVLFGTPDELVYEYFMAVLPKGRKWVKWPKKAPKEKTDAVEKLMEQYNISKKEAELLLQGV